MCGFAFLLKKIKTAQDQENISAALDRIQARGPDERGLKEIQNGIFGHQRLSIIDLTNSQQPLVSDTGKHIIVFNGEIYNYKSLRNELSPHWNFRTGGDTEVILAGMSLYGETFISKLEGMWAFGFYDVEAEILTLSRDPLGKKPIYYSGEDLESGFYSASEIPALKCLIKEPTINHNHFLDFWKYGFFLDYNTAFQEIKQVPPGTAVKVTRQAVAPPQRVYSAPWMFEASKSKSSRASSASIREVKTKLEEAVEKRLIADVEVGCFLSGGVDSSLISLLARKKQKLQTFSMAFSDPSYDESSYARAIADAIGTEHHTVQFQDPTLEQLESVIFERLGEPFIDTSILALDQLCSQVSKSVKVALSGDGADEIFGGYQRYGAAKIAKTISRIPFLNALHPERLGKRLKSGHRHHSNSLVKQISLMLQLYGDYQNAYIAPRIFNDHHLEALLCTSPVDTSTPLKASILDSEDVVHEMMRTDIQNYLFCDILRKVDAASMHHGLEVRSPFLDPEVIRAALSCGGDTHRHYLRGKLLLKQCYQSELPSWIWKRKKHGFATPVARWFSGDLGNKLIEMVQNIPNPLNQQFVSRLVEEHRSGEDHSTRLWAVYIYLSWLNKETGY